MKVKIISILSGIVLLGLLIFLLVGDAKTDDLIRQYNSLSSQDTVTTSKANFKDAKSYMLTMIKTANGGVSSSSSSQGTGTGKSLTEVALAEYSRYSTAGEKGGSYYYYWYDLLEGLGTSFTSIDDYLPVGSNEAYKQSSMSYYGSSLNKVYNQWCAMFTTCMLHKADYIESDFKGTYIASCSLLLGHLIKQGYTPHFRAESILGTNGTYDKDCGQKLNMDSYAPVKETGYVPQPGDIIFFEWDKVSSWDIDHVGIVISYDAATNKITTVEGNTTVMDASKSLVDKKERDYDETVVAFVTLSKSK